MIVAMFVVVVVVVELSLYVSYRSGWRLERRTDVKRLRTFSKCWVVLSKCFFPQVNV